jgi:hypothetical protein
VTGQSFAFDGGASIDVGSLGVPFPMQGTIELWLKRSIVDPSTQIALATSPTGGLALGAAGSNGFLAIGAEGTNPSQFNPVFAAPVATWTHLAVT